MDDPVLIVEFTGAMMRSHRVRLAYQPLQLAVRASSSIPASSRSWYLTGASRFQNASCRPFSSEADKPTDPDQDEASFSAFKKQRLADLNRDEQAEDKLFKKPYPRLGTDYRRISVPEFLRAYQVSEVLPSGEVVLTGRVRAKRVSGNRLIFLDIVNEFQKVQIMLSRAQMMDSRVDQDKFRLLKSMIQVGDHISVQGRPERNNSGQPTLFATDLPELLSPALEQIPEKLTDPETKMQERHVDMLVNREVVDVLRLRAEITKYMRDHLHSKRFLEFQTPIIAENAGGAVARPFVTNATGFGKKDLALRIAPELWLKRLVVGGVDRVFEIGPAFRNEGIDATHNPEFTMCEFYSAYSNLADLIKETEEIISGLAQRSHEAISKDLTSLPPIDLDRFTRPFKQIEFIPGLEEAMGVKLPRLSAETAHADLTALLKLSGIEIPGEAPESLPKLLDRLAAMYLEPQSFEAPVFITHHPANMSPLSKSFLCPKTYQLVSARAELFCGGRELANMYEEENDPREQDRKLRAHRALVNQEDGGVGFDPSEENHEPLAEASEEGEEASPLDDSFVKALDYGLPPTGGWGCGVERLVMLFSGANRISDCLSFGTLRNVVNLSSEGPKPSSTK